jgi:hypothetical protein
MLKLARDIILLEDSDKTFQGAGRLGLLLKVCF